MTPCSVTTGFFLLGRCGNAAETGCNNCGRPICGQHIRADGFCPECDARRNPADDPYSDDYYSLRRDTYHDTGNQYHDPNWYSTMDDYDRAPFDPGNGASGDYDPDDREYVDS